MAGCTVVPAEATALLAMPRTGSGQPAVVEQPRAVHSARLAVALRAVTDESKRTLLHNKDCRVRCYQKTAGSRLPLSISVYSGDCISSSGRKMFCRVSLDDDSMPCRCLRNRLMSQIIAYTLRD